MTSFTVADSKNLAIECFAVLAHNLERERDDWKREATIQHEIAKDAFADLRASGELIVRLRDRVSRQLETIGRMNQTIADLTAELARARAA